MGTDSYVQLAPDATGKKVATTEITRSDGATVVEIQEVIGKALVSDTPETYTSGDIQPLSITNQGRLRVSTIAADIDRIWQNTFDADSGWAADSPSAAQSAFPNAGAC